jgi:K+-transporting ATPase A subunit
MAVAVALVRGIARRSAGRLGNFWLDVVRGVLYVLLPLSLVMALVLDHFGLLGLKVTPVSLGRIAGVACVLGGIVLVRRG